MWVSLVKQVVGEMDRWVLENGDMHEGYGGWPCMYGFHACG